jgi:hypothetical protein
MKNPDSNARSTLHGRFESFVKTLDGFEDIEDLLKDGKQHTEKRAGYLFQDRQMIGE